jgi:hypothetical protein
MMRTVRTALARLRSKAQKPASGASETGAQPSETPEVRRSQGTDRAVFSTAQGWIAGDAIFDADLVDQVFFGKSYLVPVEITIGPQRLLLRWIDDPWRTPAPAGKTDIDRACRHHGVGSGGQVPRHSMGSGWVPLPFRPTA